MADRYVVGTTRTFRSQWTDTAGDPIDPTVDFTIRNPNDVIEEPAPTNPVSGTFLADVTLDIVGNWYWHWEGTTAEGTEICEGTVCVVESNQSVAS